MDRQRGRLTFDSYVTATTCGRNCKVSCVAAMGAMISKRHEVRRYATKTAQTDVNSECQEIAIVLGLATLVTAGDVRLIQVLLFEIKRARSRARPSPTNNLRPIHT